MSPEEIDRMAQKAGVVIDANQSGFDSLMHFAALVAAAEREACASICDRFQARNVGMQPAECAAAIRAREPK